MFRGECYFAQRSARNGIMEWFFYSREGVQGPYPSKAVAISSREAYGAWCREQGIHGGRQPPVPASDRNPRKAGDPQAG